MADGLKTITRRGEIGTSLPVFGLRPMRCPFLRTTNEPNDESFTVSPRSRQSVISFNTISTRVADSVRDSPTFWYTASHKSARVTVLPAIASTPLSATNLINLNNQRYSHCAAVVNGPPSQFRWRVSPTHQRCAPGKPASHRLEQHEVALFDAAIFHRDIER